MEEFEEYKAENAINAPEDLLFSDEYEWIFLDGDIATIGITDYAQWELGDIIFVELPDIGSEITQGEPFGTVEAVNGVIELFAPVSGEVLEINDSLEEDPTQVNRSPYEDGWMVIIQVHELEELDALMPADEYKHVVAHDLYDQ
jgi:glycine cleavage system H protein